MKARILIWFPAGEAPGLRTEAAQLALALAAHGHDVAAFGQLGAWRHALRQACITANESELPGEDSRIFEAMHAFNPRVIHVFGADAAHAVLPVAFLLGASGVASLGHADLPRLNPACFRGATQVCVPCEYLREQTARRLPAVPVVARGYLLPAPLRVPLLQQRLRAEELGVSDGAPVVLLADHFHGSETEVAHALIAATPDIVRRVPKVQVIIAGGGMRLSELEGAAIEVNNRLGYRAVLLPGHRDDIQQILGLALVAVGSGRFAMEAAGAGVALVAAGASGIIGAYTEDTAHVATFTCSGRHGHLDPVSAKMLASEVVGLFSYPEYRDHFATNRQQAVLAQAGWEAHEAPVTASYEQALPSAAISHTPERMIAILPDDLRALLFTVPALAGLRAQYPHAQLSVLVGAEHVSLVQQFAVAEHVLPKPRRWRDWPSIARALTHPRPDICLSFSDDATTALLSGCSFAPHRLGFTESSGSLLLSEHLSLQAPGPAERARALVQTLGVHACPPLTAPELPLAAQETVHLSLLSVGIAHDEPMILLCPQSDAQVAWHSGHWPALVRQLAQQRAERLVVLGAEGLALPNGALQVAPVSDSLTLAALLARATLVVAPDTGILHLAAVLGTPTVGLYGPTAPVDDSWAPARGTALYHDELPCHPCRDLSCRERHCMRALLPAEVCAAVVALLDAEPDPLLAMLQPEAA